jgi:hypothetical protein
VTFTVDLVWRGLITREQTVYNNTHLTPGADINADTQILSVGKGHIFKHIPLFQFLWELTVTAFSRSNTLTVFAYPLGDDLG